MLKTELLELLEGQKNRVSNEIYNKLQILINADLLQNQFILNVCIAKDQLISDLEDEYNNLMSADAVESVRDQAEQKQEEQPKEYIEEIKKEIKQEAQQQQDQLNSMADAVKPVKGAVNNENYDLPINTHPDNMTNKDINYDLIGALTLESKYGGSFINHNGERYFYKNNMNFEELADLIGKSEQTTKRLFNKILKADTNIITVSNSKNGIFYTLNSKTDNKYYTLINHKMLYQMLVALKPDALKLYLTIKYKYEYELKKDPSIQAIKLTNDYLGCKMGYKFTNGKISGATETKITSITNVLETLGFITKELKYETMWDDKKKQEITRKYNYYSICNYEQWANKNPKQAELQI